MSRRLRFALRLVPVAGLLVAALTAANPPAAESPDELIRRANAAFLRGDAEAADALYAAAEERTGDPGLVAFNRAAVLFQRGEFRDAEVHYARVLDDKACPPDRAARAWFNRGTCLLRRGGSAGVYRSAVACFEKCLGLNPADEPLKADARHNLELAKLLWAEENRKAAKPDTPNHPPPDFDEPPPPPAGGVDPQGTEPGPGEGNPGEKDTRPVPQPTPVPVPKGGANPTETKTPGNNANLPVVKDDDAPQPLSPEDTREHLRRTEERLRKERQGMLRLLYGPDRPGVPDW